MITDEGLSHEHPYGAFLHRLEKPARYTGGEVGSRVREWTSDVAKVCLAFPDVYDIGMSHLGFKILYSILNDDPRTLAERCYAPWSDLEAELRARKLPLVSLESKRPLSDFDVVGFSLQFELTYTNILTMLDLGGIPLRAADRGEADPLVIAGGPVATHPEPIAPFIDAIVIGDGEEKSTQVALLWKRLRDEGVPRRQRLEALAHLGAVYVPSLYATEPCPETSIEVVKAPDDATLPFPIERAMVDLARFPFPAESPAGGPEAIFDRMSIEIARGCTEGCRFCQAGMIYRPVRERDPEEIVDTVLRAVKQSGQDEVSLTALSTADVSCIAPLIRKVTERLTKERISLGVSSLRAYGLEPELLDDLRQVRATGLTFAPEAGTQRMRDVINKNVTEEQLLETAERVFSRGWGKMKLYFICGLPTETEDDVRGIVATGARALEVGRRAAGRGKPAEVTVSVSVHVPKPHTPFQWCAMDDLETVDAKQAILRGDARRHRNLRLKTHDARASVIEAVFARGDRPLGDVLELAWKKGARFDSWDDKLDLAAWKAAFEECGVDVARYLGTIPVSARLAWSHIDVGLEDGFLAREYRKALQSRLSPPCGKVAGAFVHATNVVDAVAETRRLVCYDCGVACDMTQMREDRIGFLERLGATEPRASNEERRRLPLVADAGAATEALADEAPADEALAEQAAPSLDEDAPSPVVATDARAAERHRYRFGFEKLGAVALLGHLDIVREFPRVLRRADVTAYYTKGFHPKPDMTFAPALSLGVMSLDEYVDVRLTERLENRFPELEPARALAKMCELMTTLSPQGLKFTSAIRIGDGEPSLAKVVGGATYVLLFARRTIDDLAEGMDAEAWLAKRVAEISGAESLRLSRPVGKPGGPGLSKMIELKTYLERLEVGGPHAAFAIARSGIRGDIVAVETDIAITGAGSVKSAEVAEAIAGRPIPHQAVRVALYSGPPDERCSPRVTTRSPSPASAAQSALV